MGSLTNAWEGTNYTNFYQYDLLGRLTNTTGDNKCMNSMESIKSFLEDGGDGVLVVDNILRDAVSLSRLELILVEDKKLLIQRGERENHEIDVKKVLSRGNFRWILARIGVVCMRASEKNKLIGRAKARITRLGIRKDVFLMERKNSNLRYDLATACGDTPISSYAADVVLNLRVGQNRRSSLKIVMNNTGPDLYVKIKNVSA